MMHVSKPQRVEAIRWTGGNRDAVLRFAPDKTKYVVSDYIGMSLLAGKDGAQEWVPVPLGHWLVHQPGDLSDVWPVDPDYFAAKYSDDDSPDNTGHGDFSIGSTVWPGTSKVIEEMGEALQVFGKLLGTRGGTSHWDGSDLRERLVEELGDVLGAIGFFAHANLSVPELIDTNERSAAKMRLFEKWHIEQQTKEQS